MGRFLGIIIVLGIFGGALFYYITENDKKTRAEAYEREQLRLAQEEERLQKLKQEEECVKKERLAALAKEDAVSMLQRYITREENRLKEVVEECKIKMDIVEVDKKSLSAELLTLEKEVELKAKDAERRRLKRRDKNERVDALLSSPTLNRLAATYLGEDFSALRAEYRSKMGSILKIHGEGNAKLAENRREYEKALKRADEDVDRLTRVATEKLRKARADISSGIVVLEKRLEEINKVVEKLEAKEARSLLGNGAKLTAFERRDLDRFRNQRTIVEEQLSSRKATAGLGDANSSHMQVTMAETMARRNADKALDIKETRDTEVVRDMAFEGDILNLATMYEGRSLDLVRAAMTRQQTDLANKRNEAERRLEFLRGAAQNMDFLNTEEVEEVRRKISEKLTSGDF